MDGVDKNIEMYFTDPRIDRDEYIEKYGDQFSPLYRIRQDIFYCMGLNIVTKEKITIRAKDKMFGPAPLAGVILIMSGFDMLKKAIISNYYDFWEKYVGIEDKELVNALKFFRHAIAHRDYGMRYVLNEEEKRKYKFSRVIYHSSARFNFLIKELPSQNQEIKSYQINPVVLLETFESTVKKLRELLKKDKRLRQKFSKSVRPSKHWVWSPVGLRLKFIK